MSINPPYISCVLPFSYLSLFILKSKITSEVHGFCEHKSFNMILSFKPKADYKNTVQVLEHTMEKQLAAFAFIS